MKNSQKIEKIKNSVLNNALSNNIDVQLERWLDYLEKKMKFPFEASIEDTSSFEFRSGDIVKVKRINEFIEMYGLILEVRKGKKKYFFSLCELEIVKKQSENRFIVEAFLEWWEENYN